MILKTSRANLSSNDQLALDLPFAATKSLTARVGPTPTFTRASSGTFIGSDGLIQTAATNTPRFDHTSAGVCRGLLIEESRTNLWSASEELGVSPWLPTNTTTVNLNNATAPDGLTTADRLTVGSTTQEYGFFRNTFSFVSGTAYSISFFFKANQITRVNITAGNTTLLPINAIFDLTGSGSIIGTPTGTAAIQQLTNGWYRCSVSATALSSGITSIRVAPVSGTSTNYPGNSVDSFWAWGAQLEAGSLATSYIPTTTGSVVRSADVCSIANTAPFWNSSEFTLLTNANIAISGIEAYSSNFNITSGFFGTRRQNSNSVTAIIRSSAVNADFTLGSLATGSLRTALAHSTGQQAGSLNGGNVIQQNSAFVPSSNPPFNIGFSGSGAYTNGHIAAIRYYRKRLPNAKLQALTA